MTWALEVVLLAVENPVFDVEEVEEAEEYPPPECRIALLHMSNGIDLVLDRANQAFREALRQRCGESVITPWVSTLEEPAGDEK